MNFGNVVAEIPAQNILVRGERTKIKELQQWSCRNWRREERENINENCESCRKLEERGKKKKIK